MKKTWFQRLIPLLLIASFLLSVVQPVSAASISGDVAPSGVVDMADFTPDIVELPDRLRYTYSFDQPAENYYSISYGSTSSGALSIKNSYDFSTSHVTIGGYTTAASGTLYDYYAYCYPIGRNFYKLPVDSSLISDTDLLFEIFVQSRRQTYYWSSSSSSYSYRWDSNLIPVFVFEFYDESFCLVEETSVASSRSLVSGTASEDSFPLIRFYASFDIPDEAVYVVPCLRFHCKQERETGSSQQVIYEQIATTGMSCTMRFDVLDNFSVDGIWEAKTSSPTVKDPITEKVNFTSGGIQYDTIDYSYRLPTGVHREQHNLTYSSGASSFQVRGDSWRYDSGKVIDFGPDPQRVSPDFYAFLTDHFTRISNSPELGESVNLKIYDYSGMNLLGSVDTSGRVLVSYTTFFGSPYDLMIIDPGTDPDSTDDDQVLYRISFGQTTNLITGVALRRYGLPVSTDGDNDFCQFVLYSGAELYVMREGDQIGGVIDPDDPAFEGIEGDTQLYDHSGSTLLESFAGLFPVTIQVKENGFHILDWAEDISTWQYVYDGPGTFAGLSTIVDDTVVRYGPGSSFTLDSPGSIYLITEEDIDDSGQDPDEDPTDPPDPGGDTDPTDPSVPGGDTDPTDPSVPGGSGGNTGGGSGGSGGLGDLDGSGLDNSSGNVSNSGNKLDGVLGDLNNAEGGLPVLPDNFADIISSSLTDAADSEIWAFMPWYDEQYGFIWDIILVPTLAGLSACLLMYAVFGKAGSVG